MLYYVNEARFELPDIGFVDRTVNELEAKLPSGQTLGILIARAPIREGQTFESAVEAHQEQERKALRSWSLLFAETLEMEGLRTIDIGVRWKSNDGMIYQRQRHVCLGREVFLLVVHGPIEERQACDQTMQEIHRTWKVREDIG